LGGDYFFQKFEANWDRYFQLQEDLTERRTVLRLHAGVGYITGDSVFFERFYGGGIGNVRGFRYRGISPRAGLSEDPIGGEFAFSSTAEVGFPLVGELIRGVVFADVGMVEPELEIGTIRSSVGAGVRVILPLGAQRLPLAVDFGFPMSSDSQDETQLISFSFGLTQ
jgi:outer membrane protein insertion porin family